MRHQFSILFVDDDVYSGSLYHTALTDAGFLVHAVSSLDEAITASGQKTFDLAILDMMMPPSTGMSEIESRGGHRSGLAFARKLQLESSMTKIAFLTNIMRDEELSTWCDDHKALYIAKLDCMPHELPRKVGPFLATLDRERTEKVLALLVRFHEVAIQLRKRHASRPTLLISDEYDVQDLLHALLKLAFSDIRAEEWTPNNVGGNSRVDFLLKNERNVIETKMAGSSLRDKKLGEQLTIDIARYAAHPDCDTLVCFVYDPDHAISNPVGLKADLEQLGINQLDVHVVINP